MTTLYVIEKHDQLLSIWRRQNATNLRVVHLDFHCDMRGLLIDRRAQRAYPIDDIRKGVDVGNFLTHAILEGRVQRVRWVHDLPGGRQHDVGTVKYESDWSVQLTRWRLAQQGQVGIPLTYEVMTFPEWSGLEAGEFLDIDWDVFACKEYPAETVEARIEAFFERNFTCVPEQISVCYSPRFSHQTQPQFERTIQRLAGMFQAKIERLPAPPPPPPKTYKKFLPPIFYDTLRTGYYQSQLWLRHQGIY
ncbi:UPF0489 family protein [Moorena sp. SIO3H5]|uniref:UPF0489 family protein n=1 Tax=Moorena sp. SIO3H5 TaxID=2607834 RepID=UPI0013B9D3EF|nr:UPF0489 family protein [Moorena sp. SIO3H5]NEO73723.1 hypothetical protein [Moorena sp. SIO3H5]